MMRFCPKCRTFYDDADLKFCPNEGIPLIFVDEKNDLWTEGTEAVRETKNQIRRETRKKQSQKIVTLLITTILSLMIISVVTINSWLYFNPAEEEIVQNNFPGPTVSPTFEPTAQPVPTIIETVSPTPEIIESPMPTPTTLPTPTLEPTPTVTITGTPTVTITPTVIDLKTPPPTPTPTPTPECSQEEKAQAISYIRNRFGGRWREEVLSQKERAQSELALTNQLSFQEITVELIFTPEMIDVSPSKYCRTASVSIQYFWRARTADGVELRTPRHRLRRVHSCRKDGANWNC